MSSLSEAERAFQRALASAQSEQSTLRSLADGLLKLTQALQGKEIQAQQEKQQEKNIWRPR